MLFSRSHIGMIGIITVFIGIIILFFGLGKHEYTFSFTNIEIVLYAILFLLSFSFYFISIGWWRTIKIIIPIITGLILYSSIHLITRDLYLGARIHSLDAIRGGLYLSYIGIILLWYSVFVKKTDIRSDENIISRIVIGILGTMVLLSLCGFLVMTPTKGPLPVQSDSILEKVNGIGPLSYHSGIIMTEAHTDIGSLIFERKDNLLSYIVVTESGGLLFPEGRFYSGSDITRYRIGKKNLIQSDLGIWLDDNSLPKDTDIGAGIIKIQNDDGVRFVTKSFDYFYTGSDIGISHFIVSEDDSTIVWEEKTASGSVLKKNGQEVSNVYDGFESLTISKDGKSFTAVAMTGKGEKLILKNGIPIETMRDTYRKGTWKSNGNNTIYSIERGGMQSIIYNGVEIGQGFDEIRDIFIEKNGSNYSFFGRKKGENTYCLITRFQGSICGFQGYMNPGISADGSTLIFAGLKNETWSIYKNTAILVQDTHYTKRNISGDYLLYDSLNPKHYIFIEKISEEQYQIRKGTKLIPGIWKDIKLDVGFGYNNKVLLGVKDEKGWRIIEL